MSHKRSVWKGAVAGFAAGFAGAVAMTAFQSILTQLQKSPVQSHGPLSEAATVKAATSFAERVLHRPLNDGEKDRAGELVHYGFGAASGAFYGAVSELHPVARAGAGLLFGAGLFLTADEIAVPLLGWSGGPRDYPLSAHLSALASHLVYGVSSEAARRLVRNRL